MLLTCSKHNHCSAQADANSPLLAYADGCFAVQVINRFLSRFTGMTTDEIEVETDRDNFLGPQAAIEKGVIDRVLER